MANTSLVERNTTQNLHVVMALTEYTCTCLSAYGKSIWQKLIERFARLVSIAQNLRLACKFVVGHLQVKLLFVLYKFGNLCEFFNLAGICATVDISHWLSSNSKGIFSFRDATVKQMTAVAPARFSTLAHSFKVEPVVFTSSMTSTTLPLTSASIL